MPIPHFSSFTADVVSGNAPLTVNFTDTSGTPAPTSWSWDFGDGSPLVSTQNPTHVYATPGNYNVVLTVINGVGPISSPATVIAVSGTSSTYTLGFLDSGKETRITNSGYLTDIVIPNSTTDPDIVVGMTFRVTRISAGSVTITPEVGVTVNTNATMTIPKQYDSIRLIKTGTDTWDMLFDGGNGKLSGLSDTSISNFPEYNSALMYDGVSWVDTLTAGTVQVFQFADSVDHAMDGAENSTWTTSEVWDTPIPNNGGIVTISGQTLVFGNTGGYELVFYSKATCTDGDWPDSSTGFAITFTGSTTFTTGPGSVYGVHYRTSSTGDNAALEAMLGSGTTASYFTDRIYVTLVAGSILKLNMKVANPANSARTYQGTVSVRIQQLNNNLPA